MKTDDRPESLERILFLESKVRELSFLQETSQLLTATLDLDSVLRSLMAQVRDYFQVEAVSVAVLDEKSEELTFRVAVGEGAEAVTGLRLRLGEGIAGWVTQHGEPVLISDVYQDDRFYPGADEKTNFRTRTVLAVPIQIEHQTIGAIEALNPITGTFDEYAPGLLAKVADRAAAAIRNAELYERARQAERRYESLFHSSPAPIVVMDFDTTILDLNQQAVELLDRPIEELIGARWRALVGDQPSSRDAAFHDLRESRHASVEMSIPSRGSLRTLEAQMTVIDYGESEAIQWIGHDITEQAELARMRDDLMHMIVHDLRNPLSNIVSSLQMMHAAFVEKDETLPMIEVLKVAMRSSTRLRRLIDSLLDLRQLEEGKADLNRIPVPPKIVALEAIEMVVPVVEKKQQDLRIDIPADLPVVWVDRDMITRVLTNLLDNAVKFTRTRGEIALTIEKADAELLFTVSDTGPGIAPESRASIFQRFQRLDSARGTKGTGLGLSFCKLAVEAHGGKIWVDSTPGEGSRFTFSLPLEVR
jgi:PAS domain S-box-containing protein